MIQTIDVSQRFSQLLHNAGWSVNRQVDISEWVGCLTKEGYVPNPTALRILTTLGGLFVRLPPAGINPYEHHLLFDPLRAATGENDRVQEWKQVIGVDLFPIGEEVRTGNVLWVGDNGRVYYGRGFGLYYIGESIGQAMDTIAFQASPLVRCAE